MAYANVTVYSVRKWTAGLGRAPAGFAGPAAGVRHLAALDKYVPGGVFVLTDGIDAWPTVHNVERTQARNLNAFLQRESCRASGPYTLCVGPGPHILVNTGSKPLNVGDTFTVLYPTANDVEAQAAALTKPGVRNQHPAGTAWELFGGFMATVPYGAVQGGGPSSARGGGLVEVVNREMEAGGAHDLLLNIAKMHDFLVSGNSLGAAIGAHQAALAANAPTAGTAEGVRSAFRDNKDRFAGIVRACGEIYTSYSPRVRGVVTGRVTGRGSKVYPGERFHASALTMV